VAPELDLVFVHQTVAEGGGFGATVRLLNAVLAARGERALDAAPVTVPLDPEPLPGTPPAVERRAAVPWSPALRAELVGEYALGLEASFLVHETDGRLFALPRGLPLAEVELFVDDAGVVFSPAVDLELTIARGEDGAVRAFTGRMLGRPVRVERKMVPD